MTERRPNLVYLRGWEFEHCVPWLELVGVDDAD
jgi:hypothetical protein